MTRTVVGERVALQEIGAEVSEGGERSLHFAIVQSGGNALRIAISGDVYNRFTENWPLPGRLVLEFDE